MRVEKMSDTKGPIASGRGADGAERIHGEEQDAPLGVSVL